VAGLVGHEHAAGAAVAARPQQAQDRLAVLGVQGAGRLVCQQQAPGADERPRDRHPLLLAAREVVGEAPVEALQADLGQRVERLRPRRAGARAVQLARQRHVLGRRQRGDQVELLEDVSHRAPAHRGQLPAAEPAQLDALDRDVPFAR